MIDLRSDTLTQPTPEMRKAMHDAELGDEGRTDSSGKGEDPTLNKLEDLAAEITGKEDAVFCCSGTMGNLVALMTYCTRGQKIGVSNNAHIYKNEKGPFLDNLGGMYPELFLTDKFGTPKMDSVKELIDGKKIDLLCLENTHNNLGGTCIPEQQLGDVCSYARENGVPVHIDGARIFNAAAYLNIQVKDLTRHVDSVMFCISKGLGAPVGSMLCGSKEFIAKARKTKKLLGGTMRQAGVLAAAGLIAIQQGKERLKEDHENAYILASRIAGNKKIAVDMETVQTNIVIADVSPSGLDAKTFEQELEKRGLKLKSMSEKHIRMVTYRGICKKDAIEAANIINELCASL